MTGSMVRLAAVAAAAASLAACASVTPEYATRLPSHAPRVTPGGGGYKVGAPYQVGGVWYVPREQPDYDKVGVASWYGDQFNLKPTADGEIFDKDIPSAAHPTLPLPSLVEVTNLDNGRKLIVRVNDRGPYVDGRLIDLSEEAARELGYEKAGLAHVRVRYVGRAPLYGQDTIRYAKVEAPTRAGSTAPSLLPRPPARAAARASEVLLTSAPATKPSGLIVEASLAPIPGTAAAARLAPLTGKSLPDLMPKAPPASAHEVADAGPPPAAMRPRPASSPSVAAGFRIQVGAFANPDNADRAVAQLASAGHASIVPMSHEGTTLYRVVLEAANEQEAEALRQRVADAGFADAQVIRAF